MKRGAARRSAFAGNRGQGMNWIRQRTRRRIYWRDSFKCIWCDQVPSTLSLDHVLPRVKGGSNEPSNLVTACLSCNEARGDTSAVLFVFDYWFALYGRTPFATFQAAETLNRLIYAMGAPLP